MTRDMTKVQFRAACERYGFRPQGVLGYYDVGHGTSVSVFNAGDNRRARLAYLIHAAEKAAKPVVGRFHPSESSTDYFEQRARERAERQDGDYAGYKG